MFIHIYIYIYILDSNLKLFCIIYYVLNVYMKPQNNLIIREWNEFIGGLIDYFFSSEILVIGSGLYY